MSSRVGLDSFALQVQCEELTDHTRQLIGEYREYDAEVMVRWDERENAWYDQCGFRLASIYEYLHPKHVYLFRQDHGNCIFPLRDDRRIMVEIFIEE